MEPTPEAGQPAGVSGGQRRRGPGRPPATGDAVSAQSILDAALHAFATHGYDGVSVRTLNREVGVSHSLINQRFGSKEGLWKAAVDHGFGQITRDLAGVFDPTLTDPLEQLRLWIRRFLELSAQHPELVGLMNIEGRQDTPRLAYLYTTYVQPAMSPIAGLLEHLADTGRIRRVPLRTFHFLVVHGGAASHTLTALAEHFDPSSPLATDEVARHAALVADLLVDGLRLDSPSATRPRSPE
ncbi:TetR/AcrR family transcriptional regulator [Rugosimonospora africana]|uniref:Putative transcriptional regulator, TetR n=1 Tax=Rugosimonospora africana TaxID=556532 RepID=A0A8J3R006_9ACTN|nr:TetR/AcrR family transcriptional regulator [Rugosimonospora africana]GIH20013.1 putative transcriptional regulator, TetR [Rugosimonospora africana]